MKYIFLILSIALTVSVAGQKNEDSKIIIKLDDSSGIYKKVKTALINSEFIVKDIESKDTLKTYSREYKGIHCVAVAVINNNEVNLFGFYGLKKMDYIGFTHSPKGYKKILYFRGSKGWELLMQVAKQVGGNVTFER